MPALIISLSLALSLLAHAVAAPFPSKPHNTLSSATSRPPLPPATTQTTTSPDTSSYLISNAPTLTTPVSHSLPTNHGTSPPASFPPSTSPPIYQLLSAPPTSSTTPTSSATTPTPTTHTPTTTTSTTPTTPTTHTRSTPIPTTPSIIGPHQHSNQAPSSTISSSTNLFPSESSASSNNKGKHDSSASSPSARRQQQPSPAPITTTAAAAAAASNLDLKGAGNGTQTAPARTAPQPPPSRGPQVPGRVVPSGQFVGLNLGNLPIFPLRDPPVQQSERELRRMLREAVSELADAGGDTLRVWLHPDGSRGLCWGREGASGGKGEVELGEYQAAAAAMQGDRPEGVVEEVVVGCDPEAVSDLKWLLRLCHTRGVRVLLVLWSHDVLAVRRDNPLHNRARVLHTLRTSSGTAAYIEHCLVPLVRHLATTPLPTLNQQDWENVYDYDGGSHGGSEEPAARAMVGKEQGGNGGGTDGESANGVLRAGAGGGGSQFGGRRLAGAVARDPVAAANGHNGADVSTQMTGPRNDAMGGTVHLHVPVMPAAATAVNNPPPSPPITTYNTPAAATAAAAAAAEEEGNTPTAQEQHEDFQAAAATGEASLDEHCTELSGCDEVPTYSSVLLGYEVFNEPEGTAWDLRLYHSYMYDMVLGPYTLDEPDVYDARPERSADHRTLQVLKTLGGRRTAVQGRTDVVQYEGWHFVGGHRPRGGKSMAGGKEEDDDDDYGNSSGGGDGSGDSDGGNHIRRLAPCLSSGTAPALQQRLKLLQSAVQQADHLSLPESAAEMMALDGVGDKSYSGGTANTCATLLWYGDRALAARWDTAAKEAAVAVSGGGRGTAVSGTWFNRLMYVDVIGHHNSELSYILPLAASCQLRTTDLSVRQLQRFISRLAAAIHRADPRASVTVGAHSIPYCTDAKWLAGRIQDFETRPRNLYSDAALKRAFRLPDGRIGPDWDPSGGGTLDFYAPHGYPAWGSDKTTAALSPFAVSAAAFQLDKPALIGEFWDRVYDNEPLTAKHWSQLHERGGYIGGLGWAMLQVVEAAVANKSAGGVRSQIAAPRHIVHHEKRAYFLKLLREMSTRV